MSELIDKTIERTMFFHGEDSKPENCPQCNQQLVQENYGPYQIAIFNGRQIADEFVMSGKFGYLCPACATAVIHIPDLTEMLSHITGEDDVAYTVLGLVNLDAVSPEQRHLPLDDLDPYPLVHFRPDMSEHTKRTYTPKPRSPKPRKPKPKRRRYPGNQRGEK